jgi:hypothetical protein
MDAAHTPTEKVARMILPVDTKNVGRLIQVSPVKEAAGTIPPSPNEKQASTNLQTSVEKEAGSILPAAKEGQITLAEPSNRIQQGAPMPNWPATPTRKSRTSDNTHDDDYGSCIHAGLLLDLDYNRLLYEETTMLAHHERQIGRIDIAIFHHAVNEDPEYVIQF